MKEVKDGIVATAGDAGHHHPERDVISKSHKVSAKLHLSPLVLQTCSVHGQSSLVSGRLPLVRGFLAIDPLEHK